nr:uncharacterized protein LOC123768625 [Procambarus clarkii]XP_045615193.1 uncharacterized protein LOC123768625 [Procambarus clarkii]
MMSFQTAVLLVVVTVMVVVVDSRSLRTRRTGRICSTRDILQAANAVCNLTRRSTRGPAPAASETSTSGGLSERRGAQEHLEHLSSLNSFKNDVSNRKVYSRKVRTANSYPRFSVSSLVKRNVNSEILTLRDLRVMCCVRECSIQDFMGACT